MIDAPRFGMDALQMSSHSKFDVFWGLFDSESRQPKPQRQPDTRNRL
jgi:hypothetical protein